MSFSDAVQNGILQAGAVRHGHAVDRRRALRGDAAVRCDKCKALLVDLCEEAREEVAAGRPIPRCPKEHEKSGV